MDITKLNKINPELLEAMNPDKQEVSAIASNDGLSAADRLADRDTEYLFLLAVINVIGATSDETAKIIETYQDFWSIKDEVLKELRGI